MNNTMLYYKIFELAILCFMLSYSNREPQKNYPNDSKHFLWLYINQSYSDQVILLFQFHSKLKHSFTMNQKFQPLLDSILHFFVLLSGPGQKFIMLEYINLILIKLIPSNNVHRSVLG